MSPRALCPSTEGSGTAEALGEPDVVWRPPGLLWRAEQAWLCLSVPRITKGRLRGRSEPLPRAGISPAAALSGEPDRAARAAPGHPSGLGDGRDVAGLC